MSQVRAAPVAGLVRVTVTSRDSRVDLAVPGVVPVAELIPALARSVGLLDATTAHTGFRLVTVAGRVLNRSTGLVAQGVGHGAILTLATGTADQPVRLHDDVAEAMGEVTQREPQVTGRAAAVPVQQAAGAAVLALGAAGLIVIGTTAAAMGASAIGLGLVGTAVVLARSPRSPSTWLVTLLVGTGTVYAAAGGWLLPLHAAAGAVLPMVGAGSGAFLAGLVGLVGLPRGRALALPPVLVGAVTVAAGLLVRATGTPVEVVLTVALVLVVLGAGSSPGLALAATGTSVAPIDGPEPTAATGPVDLARLEDDVIRARQLLLALTVTVGLLMVVTLPLAVSQGAPGALLAAACSLVMMLRTRGHRGGPEVPAALASGGLGLALVAASALALEPSWRPVTVLLVVVAGSATLVMSLAPSTHPARWTRLAEIAELAALASLAPGVLLVTGTFHRIMG